MTMRLRTSALRLTIALSTMLAGCALLIDTSDRVQCATNSDCDANPLFRGRVCELGFCAFRTPDPGPVSAGEPCVNTDICTQANSGRASVCARAGEPCVPWEIEGCQMITGPWRNPDAIMIGALMPFNMRQATGALTSVPYTTRLQRAVDLAVYELEEKNPAGVHVGAKQRPVAVLFCDSQGDPGLARKYFDHFTEVVGTKAVIVAWDDDLSAIAATAKERNTTIVCSDCLAPFPPGPAAWRIIPPITLDARLAAWRVADLEAKLGVADPPGIRVTLLTEGVTVSKAFAQELLSRLHFNGKGASENLASNTLQIIETEDPRKAIVDHDGYASQIASFAPHVIVAGMGPALPGFFVPLIEKKWPSGEPRPQYIGTQLNYEATPFEGLLFANDDLRRRFSGTFPRLTDERRANITSFELRYRAEYPNLGGPDGTFSGYEAFYATAFAIAAAARNDPLATLDGPRISSGFASLVAGPVVNVNPAEINAGLSLLSGTGSIDLRGLTSELDWNLATRDLEADMGMYCFARDGDALVVEPDPGGVVYSPKTDQVVGTYACE